MLLKHPHVCDLNLKKTKVVARGGALLDVPEVAEEQSGSLISD